MRLEKDNAIRLFNCEAPGSEGIKLEEIFYEEKMEDGRIKKVVQHVLNPEMVPYIPSSSKDKKIPAVLIIPGGAFRRLVYNFEGEEVAKWLNSLGIAAFVLKCRLPADEHNDSYNVSLIDAQRSMQIRLVLWDFQQEDTLRHFYLQHLIKMYMTKKTILTNYRQDLIFAYAVIQ